MNINWIIEKNIFETEDDMVETIKRHGYNVQVFEYIPIICDIKELPYSSKDCVIFYGSLNAAKVINRKFDFNPGVIGDFVAYNCSSYFNYLSKYLLNSDFEIVEYGKLLNDKSKLYKDFGIDNTIFIRPDSSMKPFTGSLVSFDEFEEKVTKEFPLYDEIDPNSHCVVSTPKSISYEWRFIVSNLEIISGSQYRENNKHIEKDSFPNEVEIFLRNILRKTKFNPDVVWVIDICQLTSGQLYVLEVGSFSCSGLYKNNLDLIVNKVSEIILRRKKE